MPHAVVDTNGLPAHLALTPGETHNSRLCSVLRSALLPRTRLLADRGYDADWIRELARQQGARANNPTKRNRKAPICFSRHLCRARNLIERFFNNINPHLATHYMSPRASAGNRLSARSDEPALRRDVVRIMRAVHDG